MGVRMCRCCRECSSRTRAAMGASRSLTTRIGWRRSTCCVSCSTSPFRYCTVNVQYKLCTQYICAICYATMFLALHLLLRRSAGSAHSRERSPVPHRRLPDRPLRHHICDSDYTEGIITYVLMSSASTVQYFFSLSVVDSTPVSTGSLLHTVLYIQ